uniref:Uncharacterized protein n=1 Tax=Candidatus Kentrum sp. UNK TaxID=2126344 RepID=A0A451A454_9GAMM|nr:MAG: hypothetical protein BECKUNK1418G_GA0071005_101316 [Candidatus Kentron sp. UNK]VFK69461.1 MAG: hypothetical protein BECKUNK1418H_GA0071006_101416 [Candidatus Kentron sp. UNK]
MRKLLTHSWLHALVAFIFALPIYTHFFDLFDYLLETNDEVAETAPMACRKNGVVAFAQPGGLCIQRPYGLSIGEPPKRGQETALEMLGRDFLSEEKCRCILNAGEPYGDGGGQYAQNIHWSERTLRVEKWLCLQDASVCKI